MRTIILFLFLLLLVNLLQAFPYQEIQLYRSEVVKLETVITGGYPYNPRYSNRPEWEAVYLPVSFGTSYYDYFPGGYSSYPLVLQPSPVGVHTGGGLYAAYHLTPQAGGTRRALYSYFDQGSVVSSSIINLAGSSVEGFLAIDLDQDSGDPFVSWHSASASDPSILDVFLTHDQYSLIGTPGLWGNVYRVIDNVALEERYIWPTVKIGASPSPGMKRVYVLASNSGPVGPTSQGNNGYLAYADYFDVTDLAEYDEEDWTHYEVPFMRDWAMQEIRPYFDFTVTDDGKVIIAGTLFDWGSYSDPDWQGGYSDNDALFMLVNNNWGVGNTENDWELYTENSNIQVENPDNYFTDDEGEPLDYLYVVPFAPRFTLTTDSNGDVIFSCAYRLSSTQANRMYFNQGYIKLVRFDFSAETFYVEDVYPRSLNPEAQPYVPWDPEGNGEWEYDDDNNLILTYSWPVWWWSDENFGYQRENYSRITKYGENLVIVFQDSMKARMINQYSDPAYAGWGDKPETYICVSNDNGLTWNDPIIMHANPDDDDYFHPFAGMIPSYFYPSDRLEMIDENTSRLHMMFFNQNDYGSFISENGPNSGGNLMYMAIDLSISLSSVDDYDQIVGTHNLLKPNYPNPFNPQTTIEFNVSYPQIVKLYIYNVKGQKVKSLVNDHVTAGNHSIIWDGKDDHLNEVSSGVYFYRIETEENSETRKMLLLK